MFHGRKKQVTKVPTEDEVKANQEKLSKIVTINQQILQKRTQKDYSPQAFQQTEKFSYLSPDFYTLWNYRREIITHMIAEYDQT